MSTWVDPTFGEAVAAAGLIALGRVVDSNPSGARVELVRVFAGGSRDGETILVRRASIVGRGHEASALPRGETFAFVLREGAGAYEAFTDSYWVFPISEAVRVHMPLRDPFTRAYLLFDDLAELVHLMRDRSRPPAAYLARHCARLAKTPIAATQPIDVNDQIIALESLSHLGTASHAQIAAPFLGSPHFQIRWSAVRAVATCGGPRAARSLLDLLAREDAPPVQAALAEALAGLADPSMLGELQAALPRMYGSTMPYSRNAMSPIMNTMPCPRDALAGAIAKVGAVPAAAPASPIAAPAAAVAMEATQRSAVAAVVPRRDPEPAAPTAAHLRAIASKKNLLALCEVTPDGAVPLIEKGQLIVLTAKENIDALETATAGQLGSRKLTLQPIEDGVGIFAGFPPPVTSIRLDPGTSTDETFAGPSLTALRDMARAVAVTRVAENPSAFEPAAFRRIMCDHERFVVPLQPMALAPNPTGAPITALNAEIVDGRVVPYEILRHQRPDGTHYAVVFTWEDCAEAFFTALGNRTRTLTLDGNALFRELKRVEEAYGVTSVVFDMEGPTKQSWLKVGAWKLVLD